MKYLRNVDREFEGVFELGKDLAKRIDVPGADEEIVKDNFNEESEESNVHKLTQAAYRFGSSPSALVSSGQYDKAIQAYNELISLQPNQTWHYVGRAKAFALQGDTEALQKDISMIKSIKSKDGRVADVLTKLEALVR